MSRVATTDKPIQWLTTAPNPLSHRGTPFWSEYDQGQRGWRMHAVRADESETLPQVGRRIALCGLRPAHGWDADLFINRKCNRCRKKAEDA